ncbi:MAG: hypothetical protein JWN89_662 [Parcubacteria group bacterium]|nr:hypothetical protein [Parcubacteria group bacterium]
MFYAIVTLPFEDRPGTPTKDIRFVMGEPLKALKIVRAIQRLDTQRVISQIMVFSLDPEMAYNLAHLGAFRLAADGPTMEHASWHRDEGWNEVFYVGHFKAVEGVPA